jgi:dihydroorotase
MATTAIRGGTVIDPGANRNGRFDVIVQDDKIEAIVDTGQGPEADESIDASGCWVLPGLIDMHVHLREPGYEYKETVATGTLAAVAGGVTAVACMANTNPVNDNGAVTEYILERAREAALARVHPIGALSVGLQGQQLAEIGEMREAGIVAVSDDGMPVADGSLMRRALEYSSMFDLPVIVHEEDPSLTGDGVMNEGPTSFRLGLRGMPCAAEEAMVARDLSLLECTGGHLHVAHLSTAGSVRMVREAKQRGLSVSAEVTPHHFSLTEEAVSNYDTDAKMKPPLRRAEDVAALIEGLRDGAIDVIATDHAPHHRDEKDCEFDCAAFGIVGLETLVPLCVRLMEHAGVPIETIVRALTVNPARILHLDSGSLAPGRVADIAIIDPVVEWQLDREALHSKSKNSPFGGWNMKGAARATLVGGRVVWQASEPRLKRVAR